MHCYTLFLDRRFLPSILAYYIYIYIYMIPSRVIEIPINTSHALNAHTLLSAPFRQTESCHPYWHILYIYNSKRIMEMPMSVSNVLNIRALLSDLFR